MIERVTPQAGYSFPPTFRALRHRNYRLFFLGQFVSITGSWIQMPALALLAYEVSGRQSRWPAWIAAAQFLPTFLLGFWGGTLADRWPKRTLLFWTQTLLLLLPLALMMLAVQEVRNPWSYAAVSAAIGLVVTIDFPTRLSFINDMVGREDLGNAVALNSLLFNSARLVGPMVGATLLLWAGPAACFWANSASYLAVLFALVQMNPDELHRTTRLDCEPPPLLDGIRHLLGRPDLLALLLLAGLGAFCGWPFLSLLPALADRVLQRTGTGYFLLISGVGLGALCAALTQAKFGSPRRSPRFLAVGMILIIFGLLGLSVVRDLAPALAGSTLLGFGLVTFFATGQTAMQLGAGDRNRGQVMGVWAMVLSGAQPLGNLLAGPAADRWGVQQVLGGLGFLYALVAGLTVLLFPVVVRPPACPASPDAVTGSNV
ncbi:MAG: MFS transporter [Planctomycetia bacterium]|nr:MFS transporter [Planctomycetia bacterium]